MGRPEPVRISASVLWLLFCFSIFSFVVSAEELSLVVGEPSTLQLSRGLPVQNSQGSKPGSSVVCERVKLVGVSRLKYLRKFAHSVKVKVSPITSGGRPPNVEVCFHSNASLEIGMCPQGQWEKLAKGSWVRSMSPFDHKFLDIRMAGSSSVTIEVSIEEEFVLYRIIFLVMGIVLLTVAFSLSKSLVFYYGSAMTVGVILVILMILFQGMRLLPTGRTNSLAIFVYSSTVGLGAFFLRFLPKLLRSVLVEIGITEDIYEPLTIFLLAFVVLAGAWLGFWVVRKLVLTEDGSIDVNVSHFVAWSIRIMAAVMILQSSLDTILAVEALLCGILVSSVLRKITRPRFLCHLYKKLFKTAKIHDRRPQFPDSPSQLSEADTFLSTFHATPERRTFSKEEWDKFTKDSTKTALEELVSSPDFSIWAVANAERITLTPNKDSTVTRRRWWIL